MMRSQGLEVEIDPSPPQGSHGVAEGAVELDDGWSSEVELGEEDCEEENGTDDECASSSTNMLCACMRRLGQWSS